ncbi:MAG: sigma 54-dependent Fis family transcriptional regulator [Desulfobulbaceae bacterium]|nr:sigma 54-dependent Fis family transcriptional regulator [Desulfobulbaceae bacterium]HIJ79234.1 sigma 54-interacting transcriptional regulator [Deltaproteobacteria bacterium]
MPYLIMDKNQHRYKIFPFTAKITIGRDQDNDIVLNENNDTLISRKHALITKENNGFTLRDSSVNGTLVNDAKIDVFPLTDGCRFSILHYNFTYVCDPPASEAEPAKTMLEDQDEDHSTTFIKPIKKSEPDHKNLKKRLRQAGIIAESQAILDLFMDIEEIVRVNVPVLILGEPGTGKELVAHAIHHLSKATGAFIPLNCSSIPEGIFESELFGSIKGAFHDATNKPGKLELADRGTIFLDEIGDMALSLQPKLLRFLEDKKLSRLGDTRVKTINVRVVAATNQNLDAMMRNKSFREDLYQRLACIKLEIPPLRERRMDILPLAEYFLSQFTKTHNLAPQRLSESAKQLLLDHCWPGNVRELHNVLLNCAARNRTATITHDLLDFGQLKKQNPNLDNQTAGTFLSLQEMEKMHIAEALKKAEGNKMHAAKLLGISRDTIYKKIQKYGIE